MLPRPRAPQVQGQGPGCWVGAGTQLLVAPSPLVELVVPAESPGLPHLPSFEVYMSGANTVPHLFWGGSDWGRGRSFYKHSTFPLRVPRDHHSLPAVLHPHP